MQEGKPTTQAPTLDGKRSRGWVITGLIGAGVVALCCFTPVLVGLLAVSGLGALTGYLDFVLLPALGFFLCLLAYGLQKPPSGEGSCCSEPSWMKEEKDCQKGPF
ncbi:MAG TPA: mercury resistance system transport protein MerF [Nitrospiraceae bacterium]|nr:mercury resistance system transport protein MerF [Nitrospiraceae bacterium]